MESLYEKINYIKQNFFVNIFNSSFIIDSYLFLSNLPDEIISQISSDPIFSLIPSLYTEQTKKSKSLLSTTSHPIQQQQQQPALNNIKESNDKYVQMISNFLKEKQEIAKQTADTDNKIKQALKHYSREEHFAFLDIINSSSIIKEKILSTRSTSFHNLLSFEEKVISFFHKEINDKDGYTKIKDSKFNFSTRIMDKTLTMRFEKEIEVNLLHLVSIIYEVNYYCKWYPFCKVSTTVNQPGKAKKCVYMIVEIPIIKDRDFFVYGFGINRLREDGTVLILCRGIDEESGIFQKEFKKVKNDKYVRGQILMFGFEIKVIGKGKVVVRGLCNIDPKISFIPKSIINLVSEKFAQEMFEKFIKVARQYEGSEYQNKNPSKIDMEFYNFIKEEVNELYPEYFN